MQPGDGRFTLYMSSVILPNKNPLINVFRKPPPITDTIEGAKLLLDRLENAVKSVGLIMNCSKIKFLTLNIPEEEISVVGSTGNQLEKVNDIVFLGV